ncbi:phosphoribosylformylglycinamidine synthase [Caloranaerobacter azorensis H53214]|uniref:Phosphoribosylformylglycinamidine synthase subunit PurS n=3 Tax=Caloranaerobacter azorensis TaxID=116090 RepID=A0A096DLA1_9FIRM|nr:phosphoribosylformylglycinamidine synthase [Caloranaerobacter azorensis H53214]QIB28204.1 phosphoribosylformylglycinamidine synthase subunit PurS [Caloranaerobacter azorensis]
MMKAVVYVTLKKGISDPQGNAVKEALDSLGYREVNKVRIGKIIELELEDMDKEEAEIKIKEMCEKLLANTVMEKYSFEILEG